MSQDPHLGQTAPESLHPTPDAPPDAELAQLLTNVRSIAVIGASARDGRPANFVPTYLAEQGYDVVGVNPLNVGDSLFGHNVVATLSDLDEPVDVVNVFRRNEDIPGHLDDILALSPRPGIVWIQRGLRHDDTAQKLRAEGIVVVQDRCLMVEHRRLVGAAPRE